MASQSGKLIKIASFLNNDSTNSMKIHSLKLLLVLFSAFYSVASAQTALLASGPMPCYSEKREVLIWLQTTSAARVSLLYHVADNPSEKISSEEIETNVSEGFTASFILKRLIPGKTYDYDILINGQRVEKPWKFSFKTQKLWEWREDAPDFSFITGSCAYVNEEEYDRPGKPYGGDYGIYEKIAANKGDFMLWLGDNVYLREAEWNTRDGMIYRYSHTRALPEMQQMLASMHHYAIWDDHDFGPDDSDRSWRNKADALEVFKLFWGNPTYGIDGRPGITTSFGYSDVDFFLLDNRYNRTPNFRKTGERTVLGEAQREWLIDALVKSKATFKIICMGGQFLNPVAKFENYSIFPEERKWILDHIADEGISGVIFLTGDRHSSELDIMPREGNYPLHEFTISTFSAGASNYAINEENYFRKSGTLVTERNFAKFTVSGKKKERILTCTVFDKEGVEKWTYSIKESEVRKKDQ